ncbi:MAG: single-stranded DNA-binding protein [Clostridiales bacterium]|nr:single-stranded DNA-binding protein [Clostridiales bacterium]
MNKVILVGRLTRDPEVKTTQNQVEVCSFTVAVDRRFKSANGERQADFLNCVAWRQQARLLGQYFQKGSRIGIVGNLQSRSYDDKDGKRVYVTEVSVDEIEFIDSKRDSQNNSSEYDDASASAPQDPPSALQTDSGFATTMDDDVSLPFDL